MLRNKTVHKQKINRHPHKHTPINVFYLEGSEDSHVYEHTEKEPVKLDGLTNPQNKALTCILKYLHGQGQLRN